MKTFKILEVEDENDRAPFTPNEWKTNSSEEHGMDFEEALETFADNHNRTNDCYMMDKTTLWEVMDVETNEIKSFSLVAEPSINYYASEVKHENI